MEWTGTLSRVLERGRNSGISAPADYRAFGPTSAVVKRGICADGDDSSCGPLSCHRSASFQSMSALTFPHEHRLWLFAAPAGISEACARSDVATSGSTDRYPADGISPARVFQTTLPFQVGLSKGPFMEAARSPPWMMLSANIKLEAPRPPFRAAITTFESLSKSVLQKICTRSGRSWDVSFAGGTSPSPLPIWIAGWLCSK